MTIRHTRSASHARAELWCLCCGHALGDVLVRRRRRPTYAELRAAYAAAPGATRPAWDAHGTPRCPRCAARLFIELTDRRSRADVADRMVWRRRPPETDERREDAYAREDAALHRHAHEPFALGAGLRRDTMRVTQMVLAERLERPVLEEDVDLAAHRGRTSGEDRSGSELVVGAREHHERERGVAVIHH